MKYYFNLEINALITFSSNNNAIIVIKNIAYQMKTFTSVNMENYLAEIADNSNSNYSAMLKEEGTKLFFAGNIPRLGFIDTSFDLI